MQVTETLSEGLKRGFTVVVPSTDIEGRRTAKLAEISKQLKLPGFRPGKVPERVVRQRYGTAVFAEVLEDSVNDATQQVLSDRGLRAAGQPKVDLVTTPEATAKDDGSARDLEFTVEVELLPEITLPDFSAIKLTRLKAEPAAEEVDKALANIAERQKVLEPVAEPRPVAKGETLTVDYKGTLDGVAFAGGTATDVDIEVGGGNFIPGFTEQLEGLTPGETRTIDVTFPEDYGTRDLAGKAVQFEIVAKSLKLGIVPAIDDALAEKVGFDSVDDLRGAVVRQMQREFDQHSRLRLKRDLLDWLSKAADFPVPPSIAEAEFNQIWSRVEEGIKAGRQDEEDKGKDEATQRTEYHAIAERRVRLGLLLSELGRSQGIQVTAEEMTRAMRMEASRYQGQEALVMEFFRKTPEAADRLRGPIFEDKVVDFILDQATIEERLVTPEELTAHPDDAPPISSETAAGSTSAEVPADGPADATAA